VTFGKGGYLVTWDGSCHKFGHKICWLSQNNLAGMNEGLPLISSVLSCGESNSLLMSNGDCNSASDH
jgi:hypothetical protein